MGFCGFTHTGAGFEEVPGGETQRNRSSYAWHAYCWPLEFIEANASLEEREEARDYCDTEFLPKMFQSAQEQIDITGSHETQYQQKTPKNSK